MDDQEVLAQINKLAAEEHDLFSKESRGEASAADQERLKRLEVSSTNVGISFTSDGLARRPGPTRIKRVCVTRRRWKARSANERYMLAMSSMTLALLSVTSTTRVSVAR